MSKAKKKEPEVIEHSELALEEESTVLTPVENKQLSTEPVTPMVMMQMAQAQNAPVEQMERLWALNEKVEAAKARNAYFESLAEFKKNPPKVVKDKLNAQYNSNYVSIGNMVNTVSEALGAVGLSASWTFGEAEDGQLICTCILSHALGHQESVTIKAPIDISGKKNPLQGRKSTRTYLKLETFEAATGMASVEGNIDDDGNSFNANNSAPEQTLLPVYPDDKFQSNKNTWFAMIAEGKTTAENIIATVSSKNTLTDEQIKEIRGEK